MKRNCEVLPARIVHRLMLKKKKEEKEKEKRKKEKRKELYAR